MRKFKIEVIIETDNPEMAKQIGNLLQNVVNKVEHKDITKLLTKVVSDPKIVKTALHFI